MRRVWLTMASVLLVAVVGCGRENYKTRQSTTLVKMKYDKSLKDNLNDAPTEKKWSDLAIYLRPPKNETLAKVGQLPVGEGQFDLDASFLDKTDSSLHILARVKKPKKPATKGPATVATPAAPKGPFDGDVMTALSSSVYGPTEAIVTPKFVEEVERGNRFKRLIYSSGENEVRLYLYKQDNYDVALIFVYNVKIKTAMNAKIRLTLGSFAIGPRATHLIQGGKADDETEGGPAGPL
jgi:hypothetical protein